MGDSSYLSLENTNGHSHWANNTANVSVASASPNLLALGFDLAPARLSARTSSHCLLCWNYTVSSLFFILISEFGDFFCPKCLFLQFLPRGLLSYHWSLSSNIALLGDLPWLTRDSIYVPHSTYVFVFSPTVCSSTTAQALWQKWPNLSYPLCVPNADTSIHCRVVSQFLLNEWMNKWISLSSGRQWPCSLLLWQRILYCTFGKLFLLWTRLRQFLHGIMNLPN